MKQILTLALFLSALSSAQAHNNNVFAVLEVTCKTEKGEETFKLRSAYFSQGRIVGTKFGPNRQDDGLRSVEGDCVVTAAVQNNYRQAE